MNENEIQNLYRCVDDGNQIVWWKCPDSNFTYRVTDVNLETGIVSTLEGLTFSTKHSSMDCFFGGNPLSDYLN